MAKPIKIDFIADVAQYLREVKKMDVSTDDVAEALVAVSNSSDDLERKLSKAMRDAAADTEVLERAIKQIPDATGIAATQAKADFDRIGRSAKDAGDDTKKNMGKAGSEAGSEFASNLGESLSSGDISGLVGDTLGGLVSGAGGAALAAGSALAAVVWNAFKSNQEARRAGTQAIFDAFDEVTGELDKRALLRKSFEELGGGDLTAGLRDAADYTEALGISMGEFSQLITGQVNPTTDAIRQNILDVQEATEKQVTAQGYVTTEQMNTLEAAKETLGTTDLQRANLGDALTAQEAWTEATKATGVNAEELRQNLADAVDEAARVGTGNEALDELIAKAQEIGFEALTAQEQAALIGSGNTALAGVVTAAGDLQTATGNAKANMSGFPDPGMPQTLADAKSVDAYLRNLPKEHWIKLRTDNSQVQRALALGLVTKDGQVVGPNTPKFP
jgi:hypothetical protein